MDNRNLSQPIVIRETTETQSRDLAAIIQAASKSNSVLSSVWFRKVEPRFSLEPIHIGVSVIFVLLASFVIAAMLQTRLVVSFSVSIAVAVLSAALLVAVSFRNANTTEYEVNYESMSNNQESVIKKVYKIEITKGTSSSYVDLPEFFDSTAIAQLAKMASQGQGFNVRNVVDYNVCKQPEFAQLRDKLALSKMIEKDGKSWTLTDAFFAFAAEVESDPER